MLFSWSCVRGARGSLLVCVSVLVEFLPSPAAGQRALPLEEAVALGLSRGPTVVMARADSAASGAMVSRARAFPDPVVSAQYTESPPQRHFELEQPIPLPWTRSARVDAATSARDAATARLRLQRATVAHDVEVAYVLAWAANRRRDLSARTATDARRLVEIAERRMEQGDAAELEVAVARIAAGESRSRALADSLGAMTSVLQLQRLIGEPLDRLTVRPSDSIGVPPPGGEWASTAAADRGAPPLIVSTADAELRSARSSLLAARRGRLPDPSVVAGFEGHDPSGAESGPLPVFGVVVSVPLFDGNRSAIAQARADVDRAVGALDLAERNSAAAIAEASLRRDGALSMLEGSRALLADAERVADLSGRAYEEGAFPLASVLEAQRGARVARLGYVDDVAAARVADADLRLALSAGNRQ